LLPTLPPTFCPLLFNHSLFQDTCQSSLPASRSRECRFPFFFHLVCFLVFALHGFFPLRCPDPPLANSMRCDGPLFFFDFLFFEPRGASGDCFFGDFFFFQPDSSPPAPIGCRVPPPADADFKLLPLFDVLPPLCWRLFRLSLVRAPPFFDPVPGYLVVLFLAFLSFVDPRRSLLVLACLFASFICQRISV